ncbi:cellobiose-specific phosphotransferase system component IIB [Clostridium saccharoperbutylacetonicum]|uniref:Phosphotransferase system cellobiose-specific component IIB n=1 Tax=Clostridium saccharoperbutylacetonicum N1-4(HMT) TaxID=931276 RepID=M1LUC8_9CLOT|nr:PTS sugar transporter subunit IIB [Clostridium saccharoperbutylacetonicum]AGF56670.1 phosphotransferase system cellobiose-specific component IIB [Clostridium saccharoperbutylacetonicum N1-4(HMT)]NRT62575.1 cellobiose-specific phosphotransferase system component IIB [Clostridium saccharoperbutylacetonicum]NSB25923.1 cellobiose-specific phosphotransferase system component IIB [Clostridium saccharoperbutylacetonicum]NSB45281.1 cellobiose-specific phosphotransferase system component IIB [Clostri
MRIVICCSQGMSSSIFVRALRKEIKEENLKYTVASIGIFELSKYIDKVDVVLLAPQVKYAFKDISQISKTYSVPTILINEGDYGIMNVKKVLKYIKNEHNLK